MITPLILTFNEAPNVRRTLERLLWAGDIVVVDSFSTDTTLAVVKAFPQVRVQQRHFDNHAAQWNFGVEQCVTDWVLALDADYLLGDQLIGELREFTPQNGIDAYFARIRYCIHGRPLRAALYPPRAVLFRKNRCRYEQDGHTQRLRVEGKTGSLVGEIHHDDRKSLSSFILAQDRYAALEATKLLNAKTETLGFQDRVRRKIVLAPLLVFLYTLLRKRLILDGSAGWYYVFQRTLAEVVLSLRLLEAKLTR